MTARLAGFYYVEIMVATLLIAVALVPMLDALGPAVQGAELHRQQARNHYALTGKLETLLVESFATLDAAATAAGGPASDTAYTDLAAEVPHRVFIWRYDVDDADGDGDAFTGGEDDLLWIRVALDDGSQALETLRSRYQP